MMNKLGTMGLVVLVFLFLTTSFSLAQDSFVRSQEFPFPEADINYGGTGNMVSGVDLDGDGLTEIYLVNDNWNDMPEELIPRIYKLEWTGSAWDTVWQAVAPVLAQNTWPTLNVADLDKDEKAELIWCPANNFESETNPYRLLVYEVAGDGSDVLGIADDVDGHLAKRGGVCMVQQLELFLPARVAEHQVPGSAPYAE